MRFAMMEVWFSLIQRLISSGADSPFIFGWIVTGSRGVIALVYMFLKWQNKTSLNWVKLSHHQWTDDLSHCLWCQRLIHVKCHMIMSKESGDACDLGSLRRMILSPVHVKVSGESGVNGVLSTIKNELASIRGKIRRKRNRGKNGNAQSNGGKLLEDSASNPAKSLVNGLVVKKLRRDRSMDCLKKVSGMPDGNGMQNGIGAPKRSKNAASNYMKKYSLVDLPPDARPLLVFINAKSGGQLGLFYIRDSICC